MILDHHFTFSNQQALTDAADTASTNVYDAGSAINVFAGRNEVRLHIAMTANDIGTTPTFRARMVAADNAALTTNPMIIADTGTTETLVAGDVPRVWNLAINQFEAKRYYGVMYTLGNDDNDLLVNAALVECGHNAMTP